MNLLLNTVLQEKQRIEHMLMRYTEALKNLPKGTISEKKAGNKTYYYLKYRDGNKVVSKYIRKADIEQIRSSLEKRKHVEAMIRSLQEEYTMAKKILEA